MRPFSLTLLIASLPLLLAARTPPPRSPARPPITGEWTMLWHGNHYHACFAADGYYECRYAGRATRCTVGTWSLSGDVLSVEEWREDREDSAPTIRWSVTLRPWRWVGEMVTKGGSRNDFALTKND